MKKMVAKVGEYPDPQDNSKMKARWQNVGVIMSGQHGEYVLLDPAVNLSGVLQKQNAMAAEKRARGEDAKMSTAVMVSIFDEQNQNNGQQSGGQQQGNQQSGPQQYDDDIPF